MFDAARERWAARRALKWVRRREPRPWHPDPLERRVLLVTPADPEEARPAWAFVEGLRLRPDLVLPVLMGPDIGAVAAPFLPRVRVMGAQDLDRLGLPSRALRDEAWGFQPDVALCLVPGLDRAAAALAGASPAAFRVGFAAEGAEPFFDLMVTGEGGVEGGIHALIEVLERVTPPVLLPGGGEGGGHASPAAGRSPSGRP